MSTSKPTDPMPSAEGMPKIEQNTRGDQNQVIGQVLGGIVVYGQVIYNTPPISPDSTSSLSKACKIGPNPFKGLLPFQETDGDRFFGRDPQIKELWVKFCSLHEDESATRLLTIYGPSGSGKSSLARAGLIPELARRPLPGRDRARIAVLVPGSHPLEALATVLARIATNDPTPVSKTREFATELNRPNTEGVYDGLRRIADALPEIATSPLIVLADQLEEVFTLCEYPSERDAFIGNLLCAAAERSKRVSAIVTLRSDFLGATQQHPRLNQLIASQGFFVAAMSAEGLREAITKPAELAGHPLDQSTVSLLIEQTEGREGALPLLQFALTQIWEGLAEGKEPAQTLEENGGVGGALARKAQEIYGSLKSDEQEIARRMFLGLVQLGVGSKDTRRRIEIAKLVSSQDDPQRVRQVINRFCDPGARLVTLSSSGADEETAEVTHEALFEHWGLLGEWLGNQRDALSEQRKIEAAVEQWKHKGKKKDYLLQGQPLKDAERYQKEKAKDLPLSSMATEFVEQSRKERRNGRLRFFGLFLIPLIALTVWGGFALQRQIKISQLRQQVDQAQGKKESNARFLAIQELVRLGQPLENINLAKADLNGANLNGANLKGANLGEAKLSNANLSNANLGEAKLSGADLNRANLTGANLTKAELSGADLIQAELSGVNLTEAELGKAKLGAANLSNANLGGADLYGADLSGVNLSEAKNLTEIQLVQAQAKLCNTTLPDGKVNNRDCEELKKEEDQQN